MSSDSELNSIVQMHMLIKLVQVTATPTVMTASVGCHSDDSVACVDVTCQMTMLC